MKGLVPSENINNKKTRNILVAVFSSLVLLAIVYCAIMSVVAYFTASSTRSGEISFGSVEISLTESDDTELTTAEFETQYLSNLAPGQIINFENIKVNNVGTADAYVLLNLEVKVNTLLENYDLSYDKWYNLSAEEVNSLDFDNNAVKPTVIASGESATTNLSYTVSGIVVDNKYSGANLTAKLTAYAVQTRLPDDEYVDGDLYASYFIVSQASNFNNEKTDSIFYGEPLKTGETASEELNVALTPLGDNGKCSLSASEIDNLKDKKFVVSTLVRNFEDDKSTIDGTRKGYMMSIEYVYSGGNIKKSSQFVYAGGENYNNKWVHNWISNERILAEISDENLATVNEINIYLADYNTATNRNYDVKDYVLELGVSPTEQPISPDIVKTRMAYEELKTAKQITLTEPSYSDLVDNLYCSVFNFELTNIYEAFELVGSTSAEAIFLLDGHYDLETLVSLFISGNLPEEGTVVAEGHLIHSREVPANTNLKLCVAIVSSTNVGHTVNFAKFEEEKKDNIISYETLKNGQTIIPTNISDELFYDGQNITLYNFKVTNVTEDDMVEVVAKGEGTFFMAEGNDKIATLLTNMPADVTQAENSLARMFELTSGEECPFMVAFASTDKDQLPFIQVRVHKPVVYELNSNQLITQKKIDYSYSTHTPSAMGMASYESIEAPVALYYFEIENTDEDMLITINTSAGWLFNGKIPLDSVFETMFTSGVYEMFEVKQGESQLFTVVFMANNISEFQALEFSIQTIEKIEVDYSTLSVQPTVFNTPSAEYGVLDVYNFVISNIDENADIVVTVISSDPYDTTYIMPGFCGLNYLSSYSDIGSSGLPEGTESDGEKIFTLTAGEVFEFSVMTNKEIEIQISIDYVKTKMTYEELKTAKQIILTEPSYSDFVDNLYCSAFNFELTDISEAFELVGSTSGETIFLLDGNYDLDTLISMYISGNIPEGTVDAAEYLFHSREVPANTNLKLCVAIVSSTNVDHTVNVAIAGEVVNEVDYKTLLSGQSTIPMNISDSVVDGSMYGKLYNFKITNVTENTSVAVVAQGAGTLYMASGNQENIATMLSNPPADITYAGNSLVRSFELTSGENCEFMVAFESSTDELPFIDIRVSNGIYELDYNQLKEDHSITYDRSLMIANESGVIYDSTFYSYYFEIKNVDEDLTIIIGGGLIAAGRVGLSLEEINNAINDEGVSLLITADGPKEFTIIIPEYTDGTFDISLLEIIEVDYSDLGSTTSYNEESYIFDMIYMYNFEISNIDANSEIVVNVICETDAYIMSGFRGVDVPFYYADQSRVPEDAVLGTTTFTLTAGEVFEFSVMSKQYPCEIQISILN